MLLIICVTGTIFFRRMPTMCLYRQFAVSSNNRPEHGRMPEFTERHHQRRAVCAAALQASQVLPETECCHLAYIYPAYAKTAAIPEEDLSTVSSRTREALAALLSCYGKCRTERLGTTPLQPHHRPSGECPATWAECFGKNPLPRPAFRTKVSKAGFITYNGKIEVLLRS